MKREQLARQKNIPSCCAGFTLVEILVVLSILAIITSITLVYIPGGREKISLKVAASELMTGLNHTRNQAVLTHKDALLHIDLSQGTFWTEGQTKTIKTLPQQVVIELSTAAQETTNNNIANIRFFPDGSSTGGYIKLIGEKENYNIIIHWLTGKVELEKENS